MTADNTEHGTRNAELGRLSPAQRLVLTRIGQGRMTKEIAAELNITERGVKWHKEQIYAKLNINSLAEAIRTALKLGLVVL